MGISKGEWIRSHLGEIPVLISIIVIVLYTIFGMLDYQHYVIADGMLLFLLASISIFIYTSSYKNEDSFRRIHENLDENAKENEHINTRIDKIDDSNKKLADIIEGQCLSLEHWGGEITAVKVELSDLKKESFAKVRVLSNQSDFYRLLTNRVNSATEKVWLTHLDPYAPTSHIYDDSARRDYFVACHNRVKSEQIEIRRIINIPTMDKLEWTKNLIKETNGKKNLHLAYINVYDIENAFPESIVSCQIIDDHSMFLLNPLLNVVPEGAFKKCILIENKDVVSIYEEYYEKLWNEPCKPGCPFGCIIKNGPSDQLFESRLERIVNDIDMRNETHDLPGLLQKNDGVVV